MVAATLVRRLEREDAGAATLGLARALLETCREAHADTRVALGELRRAETFAPDDVAETCSRWSSRTGVPTVLDVDVRLGDVSRALADDLRAVLLELLENVRRHAGAQKVEVQVTVVDDVVQLSVTDDGCGLDGDVPAPRDGHYGVTGIAERAQVWGGEVRSERPSSGGLRCVVTFRERAAEVAR
jgi:signal transduction histidine kinase